LPLLGCLGDRRVEQTLVAPIARVPDDVIELRDDADIAVGDLVDQPVCDAHCWIVASRFARLGLRLVLQLLCPLAELAETADEALLLGWGGIRILVGLLRQTSQLPGQVVGVVQQVA
jgi:hypothetical protein